MGGRTPFKARPRVLLVHVTLFRLYPHKVRGHHLISVVNPQLDSVFTRRQRFHRHPLTGANRLVIDEPAEDELGTLFVCGFEIVPG